MSHLPSVSVEGKPFSSIRKLDQVISQFEVMIEKLRPSDKDNKYIIFCVKDLACISLSLSTSIVRNLHWHYSAYTAATLVRSLIECVAEMGYVKTHPKKAKCFWESQHKIQEKFTSAGDDDAKWQLFIDGSISKIGQLSNSSLQRIEQTLGGEFVGRYNYLSFYSHPNIAGYAWIANDKTQPTMTVRMIAETFFMTLHYFVNTLADVDQRHMNRDIVRGFHDAIADAYRQYTKECDSSF